MDGAGGRSPCPWHFPPSRSCGLVRISRAASRGSGEDEELIWGDFMTLTSSLYHRGSHAIVQGKKYSP